MVPNWQERAKAKKASQQAAIPKEWLIENLPPPSQKNVLSYPEDCGLLTPFEVEITNADDVDELLEHLRTAKWSAVDVTTAYCKRAIIAHQLVCDTSSNHRRNCAHSQSGQLSL